MDSLDGGDIPSYATFDARLGWRPTEKERLEQILNSLKGKPVMTVSDMERFTQHRGMIGFVFEDSKVRFQVNLSAARLAGLEISSRLLKLAQKVTEDQ